MPLEALKRSHTVTSFEPFTLLSALAGAVQNAQFLSSRPAEFQRPRSLPDAHSPQ